MSPASVSYQIHTFHYGERQSQIGDLYLPETKFPALICLFHGGFWRMPYGREEFSDIARDLAAKGYAVWNIEYARLGEPEAGWPETFRDAVSAVNYCEIFERKGISIDSNRVILAGHSAGGHLALWAGAQYNRANPLVPLRIRPLAVAGLAPVADLRAAAAISAGNGAALQLLGGSPDKYPERYDETSPIELLPFGIPQLLIHGELDEAVPIAFSAGYAAKAREKGESVRFVALPNGEHMDFLNPASKAHIELCQWLSDITR